MSLYCLIGFPSDVYFVILWIDGSVSTDDEFAFNSFPIDLVVISVTIDEGYAEVSLAFLIT